MRPIIKRRKLKTRKTVAARRVASIKKVVTQVMNKQQEKRCVKARTPYANNFQFTALTSTCDGGLAIARAAATNGLTVPINDNAWAFSPTYSHQEVYDGQDSGVINREGASVRLTMIKDAGRLRVRWGRLVNADLARSCAKHYVHHFTYLLQFKDAANGQLMLANSAAGNVYRRIVYGLLETTNKPAMSTVDGSSLDSFIGNSLYSGENYSQAMIRPLNQEVDDGLRSWQDVRSDFTLIRRNKRLYKRPKQAADMYVESHFPGGINSSDVPVSGTQTTHNAEVPDVITEHDYSFMHTFKGGKLIRYEDLADADEDVTYTCGSRPLVVIHAFRSEGNSTYEDSSTKISISQCFGARSVYWHDL